MEHAVVAGLQALVGRVIRVVPLPVHPALLHLVVAAPQRQAGAVAQAAHILDRLHAHILGEGIVLRVDAAGKDEVLPDQDAVAVAQVVEALLLVEPAAPDPQHVHVGRRRIADQALHDGHR